VALIQFKRIAIRPLTPEPVAPPPPPVPTVGEVILATQAKALPNPTLGSDKPGEVTLLYNDSDTGIGYKEWATWRQGTTVVLSWGRCGTKLHRDYLHFRSEHEAEKTMQARIAQKRARGYRNNP